jgi:predicted alpha/beta hydrolase
MVAYVMVAGATGAFFVKLECVAQGAGLRGFEVLPVDVAAQSEDRAK